MGPGAGGEVESSTEGRQGSRGSSLLVTQWGQSEGQVRALQNPLCPREWVAGREPGVEALALAFHEERLRGEGRVSREVACPASGTCRREGPCLAALSHCERTSRFCHPTRKASPSPSTSAAFIYFLALTPQKPSWHSRAVCVCVRLQIPFLDLSVLTASSGKDLMDYGITFRLVCALT